MVLYLIHFNRCIVPLCDIVVQLLSSKRESYAAVYIYRLLWIRDASFAKLRNFRVLVALLLHLYSVHN